MSTGLQSIPVELEAREDKFRQKYYMGRVRTPMVLQFKRGTAFLVYTSEPENELLRIACAKPGSELGPVKRRFQKNSTTEIDKYVIQLEKRIDQNGETYYLGLVQDDILELDMGLDGYVFFVFTAKNGQEELHIGKNDFVAKDPREVGQGTEIIRRGSGESPRSSDSGDRYPVPTPRRASGQY